MDDPFEAAIASLTGLAPVDETAVASVERSYPNAPPQYLRFLRAAGFGDIGPYMIYNGLVEPEDIFGPDSDQLRGNVLLFGDDRGQVCVGFDRQTWRVVEIDHASKHLNEIAPTFADFLQRVVAAKPQ
jgi:hypothetical protein